MISSLRSSCICYIVYLLHSVRLKYVTISALNRKFDLPGEKLIRTTLLPKLNIQVQYGLMAILKEVFEDPDCHFSVTCDLWSSIALDNYLGLIVHFITSDFKRKQLMLRCMPYNMSHTGTGSNLKLLYLICSAFILCRLRGVVL